MMILHQFEISPFCDKVRRVLSAKRIPYEIREVPLTGAMQLKKINPVGKLPCLEHEGRFISDSTDIVRYLEEKFPERPVIPAEKKLRGQCHAIEEWADESLFFLECYLRFALPHNAKKWVPEVAKGTPAIVRAAAMGFVPLVMKRRLAAQGLGLKSQQAIHNDLVRHIEALDDLLDGSDWLVGDRLTIADIAVFAQLFCVRGVDEGARVIESKPRVVQWMERTDGATRERHRVAA
jgi:glutathione S-transferase